MIGHRHHSRSCSSSPRGGSRRRPQRNNVMHSTSPALRSSRARGGPAPRHRADFKSYGVVPRPGHRQLGDRGATRRSCLFLIRLRSKCTSCKDFRSELSCLRCVLKHDARPEHALPCYIALHRIAAVHPCRACRDCPVLWQRGAGLPCTQGRGGLCPRPIVLQAKLLYSLIEQPGRED